MQKNLGKKDVAAVKCHYECRINVTTTKKLGRLPPSFSYSSNYSISSRIPYDSVSMICRKKLGKISYGDVKKMRRVLAEAEAEAGRLKTTTH